MRRLIVLFLIALAGAPACGNGSVEKRRAPAASGESVVPSGEKVGAPAGSSARPSPRSSKRESGAKAPKGDLAGFREAGEGEPDPGLSNLPKLGTYVYEVTPLFDAPPNVSKPPADLMEKKINEVTITGRRVVKGGVELTYALKTKAVGQSTEDYRRERWTREDVRLQRNRECRVDPPFVIRKFPLKLEVYAEQRSAMRECSRGGYENRTIKVLSEEKSEAAGRTWNTWKIETKTIISNDAGQSAETLQRDWLAPDLGMPVKSTFETTLPNGVKVFSTELLQSHP